MGVGDHGNITAFWDKQFSDSDIHITELDI